MANLVSLKINNVPIQVEEGTTVLEAAKKLGRRYIGIELEDKYIEMCDRRLAQEYLF